MKFACGALVVVATLAMAGSASGATATSSTSGDDWDVSTTDVQDVVYSGAANAVSYKIKNDGPGTVTVAGVYTQGRETKIWQETLQKGDWVRVRLANCSRLSITLVSGGSASGTASGSP